MFELFANEDVVKVFHAAKQDVEIFVNLSGEAPKSLFDTQVAAAVCGFGDSISYDNMVRQITGAQVDKSSRFTNWSHRPLTEKQLTYAIGDVTHLRDCYLHIVAELDKRDRWDWINDELKSLMQPRELRGDAGRRVEAHENEGQSTTRFRAVKNACSLA